MTTSTGLILTAIVVYLIGMLAIGFAYSRRNKTSSDFYLGGRKLGPIVIELAADGRTWSGILLRPGRC